MSYHTCVLYILVKNEGHDSYQTENTLQNTFLAYHSVPSTTMPNNTHAVSSMPETTTAHYSPEQHTNEVTIVFVSFHHNKYVEANHSLIHSLNPDTQYQMVVVDNTGQTTEIIRKQNLTYIPGTTSPHDLSPSLHHALGIAASLPHVHTRYVLFLDPDFFIVRQNWIRLAIAHMRQHRLSIFGAPWHPKHFVKWRYFPCTHCLFIDLAAIPRHELDFSPNSSAKYVAQENTSRHLLRRTYDRIASVLLRTRASTIGKSQDTGHAFFLTYGSSSEHACDLLTPTWNPPYWRSVFEFPLPDFLSYIPKKKTYFTRSRFTDRGLPPPPVRDWEEFFWMNSPWGVHVRLFPKKGASYPEFLDAYFCTHVSQWISQLRSFL